MKTNYLIYNTSLKELHSHRETGLINTGPLALLMQGHFHE